MERASIMIALLPKKQHQTIKIFAETKNMKNHIKSVWKSPKKLKVVKKSKTVIQY